MDNFLEVKNLETAEAMLRGIPNGIERAVSSTINKTLRKVKTDIKKKTTSEYNIKAKDIESKLSVKKANFTNLRGSIYAKTRRLALSKFITSIGKDYIKVKIKKNEKSEKVFGKPDRASKPFGAIVGNRHFGIFQRKQKEILPIKQLYTISISEMLGNKKVSEYTVEEGKKYLETYLEKEVNRILKGYV